MIFYIILFLLGVISIVYKENVIKYFNIFLTVCRFLKNMFFDKKCYIEDNYNYIIVKDINKNLFYIPKDNVKKYIGKKVYLIKNNTEINITQKLGIPYFITAKDLGGNKIIIKDLFGHEIKVFDENKIPFF